MPSREMKEGMIALCHRPRPPRLDESAVQTVRPGVAARIAPAGAKRCSRSSRSTVRAAVESAGGSDVRQPPLGGVEHAGAVLVRALVGADLARGARRRRRRARTDSAAVSSS